MVRRFLSTALLCLASWGDVAEARLGEPGVVAAEAGSSPTGAAEGDPKAQVSTAASEAAPAAAAWASATAPESVEAASTAAAKEADMRSGGIEVASVVAEVQGIASEATGLPGGASNEIPDGWEIETMDELKGSILTGNLTQSWATQDMQTMSMHGFNYYASTTIYGETPLTACGSLNTKELVEGTEYYAVASAQSMQAIYAQSYGGCRWECRNAWGEKVDRCHWKHPAGTMSMSKSLHGCKCKQLGACWCGKAGPQAGLDSGTAPMGCFTCGRGQFLKRHPYKLNMVNGHELIEGEVKVVVADSCPYAPNTKWCPARAGERNAVGVRNHLDFTQPPPFDYKNNFFVFTPEPCSPVLQERMLAAKTLCPTFDPNPIEP